MIDTELLQAMHKRIDGSHIAKMEGVTYLLWSDKDFYIALPEDETKDRPSECFDVLNRLENLGMRPSLQKVDNGYSCENDDLEKWPISFTTGNTRTEAVCRMFVAVAQEVA